MSSSNSRQRIIADLRLMKGTPAYVLVEKLLKLTLDDGKDKLVQKDNEQTRGNLLWIRTLLKDLNTPPVEPSKDGAFT